ncbi:branched-chain-amino-acid transaminase bat2, partial [Coemansia erecta]
MASLQRLSGLFARGNKYRAVGGLRLLHGTCRYAAPASVGSSGGAPAIIKSAELQKSLTTEPKAIVPKEKLIFGHTFSDHMLVIPWSLKEGWAKPEIRPYGPLSLDPSCSVFHYAFECFEGMKAYRDSNGQIRLFRPEKNMERMNNSVERLYLPQFDGKEVIECIKELLR